MLIEDGVRWNECAVTDDDVTLWSEAKLEQNCPSGPSAPDFDFAQWLAQPNDQRLPPRRTESDIEVPGRIFTRRTVSGCRPMIRFVPRTTSIPTASDLNTELPPQNPRRIDVLIKRSTN